MDVSHIPRSQIEEIGKLKGYGYPHRERKYKGGPPSKRIQKMQLAHEARARKLGIQWDMIDFRTVYAHHKGLCGICGESVQLDDFTIDHMTPVSKGGPHLFANLQLAHKACNARKGDR
jgi:5-methylcytosine-specific restriction endonuclease McrA